MNLFAKLAAAACASAALLLAAAGPELGPESFGVLKDKPTYIQEWHIWWGFPYPDRQRPFAHMDSALTSDREPWRLDWNRNGYPLVGLYDSANPEIIRWQIRCMKAAGLDSVAVMIHPDNGGGIAFIQEAPTDMIGAILDIAAEEKFPVFFMDEVAFRKGSVAQNPEVMAERVIRFLKKYAGHPGFHRIGGKPVYYFQTYGWGVKPEELEAMFRKVETAAGPVHWMVFGAVNRFGAIPQIASMVDGASHHRRSKETRRWQLKEQDPGHIFSAGRRFGKKITDMQYPKFDGTSQPWRQTGVSQYGLGGRTLETTILNSLKSNPDFIMLSSWNDWEEGANFEPGWDFDGFSGDPYLYCRVIAHLRGREFVPPPLPPKEAVHPSIREKLGYGDGAGPVVEKIERSHNRGGALAVTVRDTASEVVALEAAWNGDFYYLAAQSAGGRPQGNLIPRAELPKSELLKNIFGYTPGRATAVRSGGIAFSVPEPEKVPGTFALGVATAFDPEKPMQPVIVRAANLHPVPLREPIGGRRAEYVFRLTPYPRDNRFPAELWNGWRTAVAVNPRPLDLAGKPLTLEADGAKFGLISILGDPRGERIVTSGVPFDEAGRIKTFHLTLPDEVLGAPGAHFVWLRAKDAAGNWGSPVLHAVPNYEFFDRGAAALREAELDVPGALLADNCSRPDAWKPLSGGKPELRAFVEKKNANRLQIGNSLLYRDLPQPARNGFKLTFDAAHTNFQRCLVVALTDAEGKRGYGVGWDSSRPDIAGGTGFVRLLKFNEKKPLDWNLSGRRLADAPSGHPALDESPARFELSLRDGVLTLKVDGNTVATAKENEFGEFSRLYLRGNQHQLIDNIILTP
ncbi:MAG: hypothetical protein HPZ91_05280 [Lentisphaeria bacterium]|nr:hypothetical protein [Lentisphaeria bacterium]